MSLLPLFFGEVPEPFTAPDPVPMSTYWRIEVALTTAPFAASDTWTDITTQVRSLRYSTQRGAPGEPAVPATAEIEVDNRDGRWNASSTYASAPYAGNVVPDKRVRLSFRESASAPFVVMGVLHLESVEDSAGPFDSIAVLRCSDLLRIMAQSQPLTLVRPAELTGQRIVALLNAAGIPAHLRFFVNSGTVMLPAAELSGQVLGLIHEVSRAEIARYRITGGGQFLWLDRYDWVDVATLNTSQATFAANEFLHIDVRSISGAFVTQRRVVASGASGRQRPYSSVNWPANFPNTVRQELGVPILYDGDVEAFAEATQKQHETVDIDESVPAGVEFFVASPSATNDTVLADIVNAGVRTVAINTYVSLLYRPVGWSTDRDAQLRVELDEHEVTPEQWTWRLGFSAADSRWRSDAVNHFYQFGTPITADHRGSL
jgi:hypothetical protein